MTARLMSEELTTYSKPTVVTIENKQWHKGTGKSLPMFRPHYQTYGVLGFICDKAGIPSEKIKYLTNLAELRVFEAITIPGLEDRWVDDILYVEEVVGLSEKQRRERIQYLGSKVGIDFVFAD